VHNPVNLGIRGIIATKANMQPRFEYGAALTDQDASRRHKLATEALNAQALADTIASVPRATPCLFMRHGASSTHSLGLITRRASDDLTYAEERLRLAMALPLLVALASFVFINKDLGAALLPDDRAYNTSLLKLWLSDGDLVPLRDHQHRGDLDPISCGAFELFDRNQVTL
jgi:hypothetical protein